MQLSSESDARISSRPESNVTDSYLVDTGIWPAVDTSSALGLELAGAKGPPLHCFPKPPQTTIQDLSCKGRKEILETV